ncbi:DUF2330 domain-containing protein [Streptomyces sp. SID5785]|uniref:DUF2330 domain-containing protein n=1 Tax=Streptomyces sp. SID5785 TaxID=2690309 RepID=UPI001361B807|nr:DUF2330 domain-containing protein [Streptomyces sp. SID5785]MZD08196.1 DUF2330 domain-containing protein [Streptomyces sp. SID5785]
MTPTRTRAALITLAALLFQLLAVTAPANACGCGAMVPRTGERITVDEETSALRWDGRTEQIVMRLAVHGDGHDVAWVMPVPHRATVKLGDPGLFTALAGATAPELRTRHYFWPRTGDWPFDGGNGDGAAAGAPAPSAGSGVGVVGRERLGPFDVARLTATDPHALAGWLDDHGFALPARLDRALRPYVDQGWEYVAIRLAPTAGDGTALTGRLDPLHLTFASERPVYPMRLSRLARTAQHLDLYVLADHRMEPRSAIGGGAPRVTFAGKVTDTSGPLAELATGAPYLTAYAQDFPTPSRIDADHTLRRAADDTPYRQVEYENELLTVGPDLPLWLLTVLGTTAAALTTLLLTVRARRRRPVARPAPVRTPPPLV